MWKHLFPLAPMIAEGLCGHGNEAESTVLHHPTDKNKIEKEAAIITLCTPCPHAHIAAYQSGAGQSYASEMSIDEFSSLMYHETRPNVVKAATSKLHHHIDHFELCISIVCSEMRVGLGGNQELLTHCHQLCQHQTMMRQIVLLNTCCTQAQFWYDASSCPARAAYKCCGTDDT